MFLCFHAKNIYAICVLATLIAFVVAPLAVFAAPLKKTTDKIGQSLCPYSCQSAVVVVMPSGDIAGECLPQTEALAIAENTSHPQRGAQPSRIQRLHLECEQVQCGILQYTTQNGETYNVNRCIPTPSYEEGDVIPLDKPENEASMYDLFRDERVIDPDLFPRGPFPGCVR